jgi:inorganic triphosphatase YgiF
MSSKHNQARSNGDLNRERELKLECNLDDIGKLLDHPILTRATSLPQSSGLLRATYFDTPDLVLQQAGIALRIRKHNGRFIQTIKAEGQPRGIALDRTEWEHEVDGNLDASAAFETPLRPFLENEAIRARIQPLFTVKTIRRAFLIDTGRATIELALDRMRISARGRSSSATELELELKAGEAREIFRVAKELARTLPLRLSVLAKSDRGYRLLESYDPKPVKARRPPVAADTASAVAFQTIARETLSQIVQNEELWRSSKAPEALHQMRVGLRRLRTAMAFFKPVISGRRARRINVELRWVSKKLNRARDLDVLLERLQSTGVEDRSRQNASGIAEWRNAAYETLARKVEKPRFKSAILNAAIWIESGGWLEAPCAKARKTRDKPVVRLARKALARRWKRVSKDVRRIPEISTAKRHALRVRIKALRYGCDFFADAFAGHARRKKAMIKSLEHLQDVLGEMNDISVGHAAFAKDSTTLPEGSAVAIQELMPEAEAAARRMRSIKPFWE